MLSDTFYGFCPCILAKEQHTDHVWGMQLLIHTKENKILLSFTTKIPTYEAVRACVSVRKPQRVIFLANIPKQTQKGANSSLFLQTLKKLARHCIIIMVYDVTTTS